MSIELSKSRPLSTAIVPYAPRDAHAQLSLDVRTTEASRRCVDAPAQYLETYKALHLGGRGTLESQMIRSFVTICPTHTEAEMAPRLSKYDIVSKHLSSLSDQELRDLLATAHPIGSGTGGEVLSIEVEGVTVFVKKIRLTAIEEANPSETSNLFKLPIAYQYGVGSMGFGVWREIEAHKMTTQWVLTGECQNFPLTYHDRVLQRSTAPAPVTAETLAERKSYIEYWDGSTAVGKRAEAADSSLADVVVFMEHIPQTLSKRLKAEACEGTLQEESLGKLDKELSKVTTFMKSHGFLHFDAHFSNVLADPKHVYFADFGLAISDRFDLSLEEIAYRDRHQDYDRYYVILCLVTKAITSTVSPDKKKEVLDAYFSSKGAMTELPPSIATFAMHYRPIALLMDAFFHSLYKGSKSTPYPEAELAREWSKLQ
ncbi:MAG: protein kinase family protein [Chlamydiae bacterium]|nr:protein kinase family protein [Chlamydiota bacterium]